MKKITLLTCLFALASFIATQAQTNVNKIEIWGNVSNSIKCKQSKKTAFGLYKIIVTNDKATFTPLATGDKKFAANGGGVIYEGHCDFVNIGGSRAELRSFNTLNWSEYNESGEDVADNNIITSAAAHDKKTGKIYACLTDNKGKEHKFGYVDYDNFRRTVIGFNENHYVAMATDAQGVLYAVNINGELHKIDARGNSKTIGKTGVTPSDNVQAMAFNENDGKMYWAAAPKKGNSFLCSVDLNSGNISKVCDFTGNDIISCMYIPIQPESDAPSRLYDMDIVFEGALNKGNIFFTLPTEHYRGSTIDSEISYEVFIDNVSQGSLKGKAGEKVNVEVFVEKAGMHDFKIVLETNGKSNPYNQMSKWIGYDEPAPIRNLKYYTNIDKIVYLSWKAPRGGRHGGYVDMKNLVYKIVRKPGDLVVSEDCSETHFEDDVSSGGVNGFYYEVTPYIKDKE